jgi:hypothetical protein
VNLIEEHPLSALEDNLLPSTEGIEDKTTAVPDKWGEYFSFTL